MKSKNFLNSLESTETWGHSKFSTGRICSQIQQYGREDPLGQLQNLNLAQNSEFWNEGVLIQALICLKQLPSYLHSLSKTGSSPHRRCVLLSLLKARAHDRGAGRADGGRLPTGSDPQRRARCQAEGGKPDGEHKERNCSRLPSERIMVGLNELKGLFQPKCFYDRGGEADSHCTWVCTCPEHRTPQSLLCWVMAAWEQTACPRAAAGSIAPRGDRKGNSGGCSICRAGMSPFWAWSLQGLHPAAVTTRGTQLGCPSLAVGHKM